MSTGKTATLTIRIEPALKDAIRAAAEQEHRSIANMIEVMIRQYCLRSEIAIAELPVAPSKGRKRSKRGRVAHLRLNKPE